MPSGKAFKRDLRLYLNESLVVGEKLNDTYALLSRILGFSVVRTMIVTDSVPYGKEISYYSLSGFGLFVFKDLDGMLVVNRVRSERVDLKKGKIVLQIMDGVIMEADLSNQFCLIMGKKFDFILNFPMICSTSKEVLVLWQRMSQHSFVFVVKMTVKVTQNDYIFSTSSSFTRRREVYGRDFGRTLY